MSMCHSAAGSAANSQKLKIKILLQGVSPVALWFEGVSAHGFDKFINMLMSGEWYVSAVQDAMLVASSLRHKSRNCSQRMISGLADLQSLPVTTTTTTMPVLICGTRQQHHTDSSMLTIY